jgi:Domain of unknown function (DUF222)
LQEVAAYDRSHDWRAEGFLNSASALRHACHLSQGVARGHVELARKLEELPDVAAAFGDGEISARHARVIADACTPERAAEISEVEGALVEYARDATPHDLGRVVRYVTDAIDGDGGAAAEDARYRRRRLQMSHTLDGMLVEDGLYDPESARIRAAAIDAELARDLIAHDDRSPAQRRADASTNIMRLYLDRGEGGETHGVRPHVSYVIDIDQDLDGSADLVARARTEDPRRRPRHPHRHPRPMESTRRTRPTLPTPRLHPTSQPLPRPPHPPLDPRRTHQPPHLQLLCRNHHRQHHRHHSQPRAG